MKGDLQRDILERWRPVGTPRRKGPTDEAPLVRRPLTGAVWALAVTVLLGLIGAEWDVMWLTLGVPTGLYFSRLFRQRRNL